MRRRQLLVALLAAPWVSHAQSPGGGMRRIAFLGSGSAASIAKPLDALRDGLRRLGYEEGKTIAIEYRWGEGRFERLPALAKELVNRRPELLVAWGTPATLAAKGATSTLPIVMCNTGDPDATGIVASLSRPGANITGVANLGGLVVAKQLELMRLVIPRIARIAVLMNPENVSLRPQLAGAERAARSMKMNLQVVNAARLAELEPAFSSIAAARAEGLLVLADPFYFDQAGTIAGLAIKRRLPSVSARSETADSGILVTYGASTVEQFRAAAPYVDKILRGANPGELPIEQAAIFDLVFNLRTAKTLGIVIPPSLIARADRVVK